MTRQFLVGTLVIVATVLVNAGIFALAARRIDALYPSALRRIRRTGPTLLVIAGVLSVLVALTVDTWLWALVLERTGALPDLESSVYFALVSFTTLGFGDLVLEREWRILSGLIGANGLLIFGWSTAFMVALIRKLHGGP